MIKFVKWHNFIKYLIKNIKFKVIFEMWVDYYTNMWYNN